MVAKNATKRRRSEVVTRGGLIVSCDAEVHIHADRRRGLPATRESSVWRDVKGTFREPVIGISNFSLLFLPATETGVGQGDIPSIGGITQFKPVIHGLIYVAEHEFGTLALLASANKLRYLDVAFTQPYRNRALIIRVSFSSNDREVD